MAAEDVPNLWNCYPWDAAAYGHTIEEHEALARQCLQGANASTPAGAAAGGGATGAAATLPCVVATLALALAVSVLRK